MFPLIVSISSNVLHAFAVFTIELKRQRDKWGNLCENAYFVPNIFLHQIYAIQTLVGAVDFCDAVTHISLEKIIAQSNIIDEIVLLLRCKASSFF